MQLPSHNQTFAKSVSADIPVSWSGSSTAALMMAFEQLVRGMLKDGRIEPEGANVVIQKLVDTLYAVGMPSKIIEDNLTETFIVGHHA